MVQRCAGVAHQAARGFGQFAVARLLRDAHQEGAQIGQGWVGLIQEINRMGQILAIGDGVRDHGVACHSMWGFEGQIGGQMAQDCFLEMR